jgi:hypothetical protein
MSQNIGVMDRWFRILLGLALILLVFVGPRTARGWLGLLPLATGLFGYCALYRLTGWDTRRAALR